MPANAPLADLHTHVTPGVDDGAPDMDHAIRYLRRDAERGVRRVAATPHLPAGWADGSYRRETVDAFERLRTRVRRDLPRLELTLAYELRLDGSQVDPEDEGLWLGPGRHLLVEYDGFRVPSDPLAPMRPLLDDGLRPILVHPERFHDRGMEPGWEERVREAGVLLCPNAGSFLGSYGESAARRARDLLARGAVDLVASDQHARPARAESVADLAEALEREGAGALARTLLWENPVAVLEGRELAGVDAWRRDAGDASAGGDRAAGGSA